MIKRDTDSFLFSSVFHIKYPFDYPFPHVALRQAILRKLFRFIENFCCGLNLDSKLQSK